MKFAFLNNIYEFFKTRFAEIFWSNLGKNQPIYTEIERAEYLYIDGYPTLSIIIDGKEALVEEFKHSILDKRYIPLVSRDETVNWSNILPEIAIQATANTPATTLRGYTDDPAVLELAHNFWKAVNNIDGKKFVPGPIDIP